MPLKIVENTNALSQAAFEIIHTSYLRAVAERGEFHIALSGGSTPRALFQFIAQSHIEKQFDWSRVHIWWSDERNVPATDNDSNYRMANDALLAHIAVPFSHIHRIKTELGAESAANEYDAEVNRATQGALDVILLGMGDDGHTASLFPGTLAQIDPARWVVANFVPKLNTMRITFTPRLIHAARAILFFVSGANKATMLHMVLRGAYQPDTFPSQIFRDNANATWLVDQAAASSMLDL